MSALPTIDIRMRFDTLSIRTVCQYQYLCGTRPATDKFEKESGPARVYEKVGNIPDPLGL